MVGEKLNEKEKWISKDETAVRAEEMTQWLRVSTVLPSLIPRTLLYASQLPVTPEQGDLMPLASMSLALTCPCLGTDPFTYTYFKIINLYFKGKQVGKEEEAAYKEERLRYTKMQGRTRVRNRLEEKGPIVEPE